MTELPEAQQRLGWLLFQAGKTAGGTALEQYCALGMVAARELLSDPAGWARDLGIPLGKPVDETAYLQARIGSVKQMLSKLTDSDFLIRTSMESHLAEMEAELAELAHQAAPVQQDDYSTALEVLDDGGA